MQEMDQNKELNLLHYFIQKRKKAAMLRNRRNSFLSGLFVAQGTHLFLYRCLLIWNKRPSMYSNTRPGR
jgi:hypothetical protein